jgi:hypothetical protein
MMSRYQGPRKSSLTTFRAPNGHAIDDPLDCLGLSNALNLKYKPLRVIRNTWIARYMET